MNETINGVPLKANSPGRVIGMQGDVTQDTGIHRILNETQETQRDTSSAEVLCTVLPSMLSSERSVKRERSEWFAQFVSRPFDEFIHRAWDYNRQEREEASYPDWHSELFWFIWLLRGHPAMQPHLERPKKALTVVEKHLRGWTEECQEDEEEPPEGFCDGDAWQEWFGVREADARAEFIDVWQKVRFMPGSSPLQQAADAARRVSIAPSKEVMERRVIDKAGCENDYVFFLSLAGHLQVIMGDRTIMLPCAQIGEIMQLSKMTISRYRGWAQEDGYLKLAKPHCYRSSGGGKATEFRFDVGRWKCLSEKAQRGSEASFEDLGTD